jgi:RNA polymerase sigma-70 factor, ECF subfamily
MPPRKLPASPRTTAGYACRRCAPPRRSPPRRSEVKTDPEASPRDSDRTAAEGPAFDPAAEARFVREAVKRLEPAVAQLAERMRCVARFLALLNHRFGNTFDRHDLDDMQGQVAEIALRKLAQFAAEVPLECWLYRMCEYEILNALRRRARDQKHFVPIDGAEEAGAAEDDDVHRYADVHEALERLGGVEAETIRMRHFNELTFDEIGRRLRLPGNTAKTRYHRGRERLARILRAIMDRQEKGR